MQDVLIVANGDFLSKELLVKAIQHKTLLALDGAAVKLAEMEIRPDIILGDFDSISINNDFGITKTFSELTGFEKPYQGKNGILIVPAKDQRHTDLTKAIMYCDSCGAQSITIVCGLGGRLDHHEGTLRNLRRFYKKDRLMLVHSEQQTMRFAKDETIQINGQIGDKCGVLAFPKGQFSSDGLAFEANQYPLDFAYSENICNALTKSSAKITVQGEALLVMPSIL